VPQGIDAERHEAFEIDVLDIFRMRFEDHLELVIVLQTVGVLAVAAIRGTTRRLDISGVPRFGSEYAEKRGRVKGPGANLGVVRLMDNATLRGPEILQCQYKLLKCQ
jgi:hypothetical protein